MKNSGLNRHDKDVVGACLILDGLIAGWKVNKCGLNSNFKISPIG